MPAGTSEPDEGQTISPPKGNEFDRYSHIKTEAVDIIYDTERDSAWIQATSSVLLEEWR